MKKLQTFNMFKIGLKFSISIWLIVMLELIATHFAFRSEPLTVKSYAGFLAFFAGQIAMGIAPLLIAGLFPKFSQRIEHWHQLLAALFLCSFLWAFLFKMGWIFVLIWYFGKAAFRAPFLNGGILAIWGICFLCTWLEIALLKKTAKDPSPVPTIK